MPKTAVCDLETAVNWRD